MKHPGICGRRPAVVARALGFGLLVMMLFVGLCGVAVGASHGEHTTHQEAAPAHDGHGGDAAHDAHGEGGHGEGDHGAHGSKGWVATDTYRVINFAVLAIALFFVLRKPVANAMNGRIEGIRNQLEELEAKKAKAQAELAEYERKLATLDAEAGKIEAEYQRQGEEARERILKEAEAAAAKLKEQASKNIENEFKRAKQSLQAEILEHALTKAEAILRANINYEDQERLVDEYLEKVVAQ